MGEEEVAPFANVGDIVLYHTNNPNEDGMLSYPAIVTQVNLNGSVSLTVFLTTFQQTFTKIPFAKKAEAGYFTFRQ